MYDDDFTHVKYNYFNEKPIIEYEEGTYADQSAEIAQDYVMWNHPTSEVLNSLIQNNLEINTFDEFNYSPYPCFQHVQKIEEGNYIIPVFGNKIPYVFAITATKKPT